LLLIAAAFLSIRRRRIESSAERSLDADEERALHRALERDA